MFHELIVMDVQVKNRPFHLRRDSDEVCQYFGVVGAWLECRVLEYCYSKNQRADRNADTDQAAEIFAPFGKDFESHKGYSLRLKLSEENEPQREREQRCQARIENNRKSDWNAQAHQQPADGNGKRNGHSQAHEPRGKKRTHDIECGHARATRGEQRRQRRHESETGSWGHGPGLRAPGWIVSPVRNT